MIIDRSGNTFVFEGVIKKCGTLLFMLMFLQGADIMAGARLDGGFSIKDNPYGYSAYYNDKESGLDYCKARYYSPRYGAFTSRDTYDLPGRYAYCGGSPVMHSDPEGHMREGELAATVARLTEELATANRRIGEFDLELAAERQKNKRFEREIRQRINDNQIYWQKVEDSRAKLASKSRECEDLKARLARTQEKLDLAERRMAMKYDSSVLLMSCQEKIENLEKELKRKPRRIETENNVLRRNIFKVAQRDYAERSVTLIVDELRGDMPGMIADPWARLVKVRTDLETMLEKLREEFKWEEGAEEKKE